jgi:hypothetical protein
MITIIVYNARMALSFLFASLLLIALASRWIFKK